MGSVEHKVRPYADFSKPRPFLPVAATGCTLGPIAAGPAGSGYPWLLAPGHRRSQTPGQEPTRGQTQPRGPARQTGPGVVVTYSLSASSQVTVEVLNVAGRVVRRLAADSLTTAGVNNTVWNLHGDSGAAVPSGLYLVRVTAVSDSGQRAQTVTQVNVNR